MDRKPCFICGHQEAQYFSLGSLDGHLIKCPTCGEFEISGTLQALPFESEDLENYILSAVIREATYTGQPRIRLLRGNLENYRTSRRLPSSLSGKLDKILLFIYHSTAIAGEYQTINVHDDYPIGYCVNEAEFDYLLEILSQRGLIESRRQGFDRDDWGQQIWQGNEIAVRLTVEGWERVDNIKKQMPRLGNQCFVAMCFDEELRAIYEEGIAPAIRDTDYSPLRIDHKEYNGKICDRILVEIKQSRLVVADFTEHRAGVYFEAGYAAGLNIPVIWTVREDQINGCHFDTRQYNHIVWKDAVDLKEKLQLRILATAPLSS